MMSDWGTYVIRTPNHNNRSQTRPKIDDSKQRLAERFWLLLAKSRLMVFYFYEVVRAQMSSCQNGVANSGL